MQISIAWLEDTEEGADLPDALHAGYVAEVVGVSLQPLRQAAFPCRPWHTVCSCLSTGFLQYAPHNGSRACLHSVALIICSPRQNLRPCALLQCAGH